MNRSFILIGFLVLLAALASAAMWWMLQSDEEPISTPVVTQERTEARETQRKEEPPAEPLKAPAPVPVAEVDEEGASGTSLSGVVLSPSGSPVADAVVTLMRQKGTNLLNLSAPHRARPPVTTGRDGSYTIEGLDGGDGYSLHIEHGAYSSHDVTGLVIPTGELTKLGDIQLKSGVEIHGVVAKPDGNPIASVQVRAIPVGGSDRPIVDREPRKVALTDADGVYRIQNLTPGNYDLAAILEPYRVEQKLGVRASQPGTSTKVDFAMREGFAISGKIVDLDKNPIEGAVIEVREQGTGNYLVTNALSRSDGNFTASGLAAGKHRLKVSKTGYSPSNASDVESGSKGLMLALRENVGITGFVVAAADDAPIKSFGVMLFRLGRKDFINDPVGEMHEFQRTADGSFTIEDVRPGRYKLQAWANGFAPGWSEAIEVARIPVHDIKVKLGKGGVLSGKVVDGRGEPLAGADVRLLENVYTPGPLAPLLHGPMSQFGSMKTDEKGDFRFENVEPNLYQVMASFPDHTTASLKDLKVEEGKDNHYGPVVLTTGGTVAGTVVDENDRPVANAKVMLIADDSSTFESRCNRDGEFAFRHLVPGIYQICPQAPPSAADANDIFKTIVSNARSQESLTVVEGQVEKRILRLRMN